MNFQKFHGFSFTTGGTVASMIQMKNVYKVYKNGVAALNGIDVSIQKVILYMW